MKRTLSFIALTALLSLGATGSAFAWPGQGAASGHGASESEDAPSARGRHARRGRRGGMHMRRMRRAFAQLDLTNAQKTEIRSILSSARNQARSNRTAARELTPEARRALMRSLKTSTRAAVMNVLTDAQKAELRELRANRRARRGNRGNRTHGPRRAPAAS